MLSWNEIYFTFQIHDLSAIKCIYMADFVAPAAFLARVALFS
jgi:hypothetical protein